MSPSSRRLLALACAAACLALPACGGGEQEDSGGGTGSHERAAVGDVDWPLFGRVPTRTHYLPAAERFNPPLKPIWSFNARALIEFPPAIADGIAYVADKYGDVYALRLSDRRVLWDLQKDPRLAGPPTDVTAPVYYRGRVYVAFEDGRLIALDAGTGKAVWTRDLHSRLESSPNVVGGILYMGSDKTYLYAIDAETGKVRWRYNAPDAIKASPSVDGRRVYVGDYAGVMFALDRFRGRLLWRTDTTTRAPFGDGGFYSSPAIAGGGVFAARDDGTVFAFDKRTGKERWSFPTDGAIYGSPALAKVPGTPLTVYIGSYDSSLYAIDARTGRQEWRYRVGGPVPGTATVIGRTVYTSDFKTAKSIGIDVKSHRKTFSFDSPGYTPMVSDGTNLYLIGYFTVHGMRPR